MLEALLKASTLDAVAGSATRLCQSCGIEEVPVGPCFVREQMLGGGSNPNIRICLYAARKPLHVDVYPPFDTTIHSVSDSGVKYISRDENKEHYSYYKNRLANIDLLESNLIELCKVFEENQVVVLKAPTGYGKSTKLPYWLCWHERSRFARNSGRVIVTEPKRLAAEGVANVVAMSHQFHAPGPGLDVGLHHGEISSSGESNKLVYVTDGSLISRLIKRELNDVQLIVVDEAHERNERIELILLLLRFVLPQYPHLKLLILSATIEPKEFVTYFSTGSEHFLSVKAAGVAWEQAERKYERIATYADKSLNKKNLAENILRFVNLAIETASREKGHVLVFLPGESDIDALAAKCEAEKNVQKNGFKIKRLSGQSSQTEREQVNSTDAEQKRLLILATNVAESSVTVNDLVCVVDSGWRKVSRDDDLVTERISKAEANQRRGRVGRNRNGWYFACYSEADYEKFVEYPESSLVEISDYQREILLLRAMSVGIPPQVLRDPNSFLLAPESLTERNKRVMARISAGGGISGSEQGEYLTPLGLAAAASGVSLDLARLLLIADHHNVLTELSVVASNMALRREGKRLRDSIDEIPDFVDDEKMEGDDDEEEEEEEEGEGSSTDDDEHQDADGEQEGLQAFEKRRDISGDIADSYVLQSFDKLEEEQLFHTAALQQNRPKKDAANYARQHLEKVNGIRRDYQERVPEDRIREIDPRLFLRAQMVVDLWRTGGWLYEVVFFADANLYHIGAEEKPTQREKDTQTLFELEGRLSRTHGSHADPIILGFAELQRSRGCDFLVVTRDKFNQEWKGFHDLKRSKNDWLTPRAELKTRLDERWKRSGRGPEPRLQYVIIDASNVCRTSKENADVAQLQAVLDEVAKAALSQPGARHVPRNSLLLCLNRSERELHEGPLDEELRRKLVPEISTPVGSRWRKEGLELSRDDDAETRVINEVLRGGGQGLLRAQDDQREEPLDVDSAEGIRTVLNQETMNKCFYNDALKKQFLVSPAAIARELRRENVKPPQTQSDKHNFRVFRARGSRELEFSPSYLESHVIDDLGREEKTHGPKGLRFKLYRDKIEDGFLVGKQGEVKRVKVEVDYPGLNPVIEIEAWQVCPWFSPVPNEGEYGEQKPKQGERREARHSRFPNSITEFGDHVLRVAEVCGQRRLICTSFDLPNRRNHWLQELNKALVKQSSADSNKQISRTCEKFSKSHAQMWDELSKSGKFTPQEIERFPILQILQRWFRRAEKSEYKFKVEVKERLKQGYRVAPKNSVLIEGLDRKDWPEFVLETTNEHEVGETVSVQVTRNETAVFVRPSTQPVSPVPSKPSKRAVSPVPSKPSKRPVSPVRFPDNPTTPNTSRTKETPVPAAPKRATPQSPRRKRVVLLLLLAGLVLVAVTRCGGGEPSVEYQDSSPATNATTTEFSQVTMPVPITADEWFAALNCVENPQERVLESAKTVHVCYVAGDPDSYPISLFVYRDYIGDDLAKRKRRACKNQATGEVFAYWDESIFIFTVYREAVLGSSMSVNFEELPCVTT
jgi:HrpA-like RNA helicase